MDLRIVVSRVTNDEHPYPWRWEYFIDLSPQFGILSDAGLADTEENALEEAQERFIKAVEDKQVQKDSKSTYFFAVKIDDTVEVTPR